MPALLLWATLAAVPVRVTLQPEGVPGATCALKHAAGEAGADAERLVAAGAPQQWVWRPRANDVLACAAPGFEPVDLEPARAGTAPAVTVELLPARPLTLVHPPGDDDAKATLEWRVLERSGTSLRARRDVSGPGPTTLLLARRERILRIVRAGASPVSLFVPAGTAATIEMPAPRPGGEIWGKWPSHRYRPEALELLGRGHHEVLRPGPEGVFGAVGLPSGAYAISPRYRGGHAGRLLSVSVRAGSTTEIAPPASPEPGAARVSLAPPLCGERELALELRSESGVASTRSLPESVCDVEVEGLAEGRWKATVVQGGLRNEERAAAGFDAIGGASVAVALEPVVRVSGRVTVGGEPARRLRLVFSRGPRQWNAETDGDGAYRAVLGDAGEYGVSLRASAALPSQTFARTWRAGDQEEDFALGEGAIAVRVRAAGEPLTEDVHLALMAKQGARVAGSFHPQAQDAARFVGLEYGEYTVSASTASGLTSRTPGEAVLSPSAPEAEVVLDLGRHRGRLVLADARGGPLIGARAQVGLSPLREQSPGIFVLDAVAMGERLTVNAPGFAPVCRVLQAGDLPELRMTLQPADASLTLHFPADLAWHDAALVGLPGSDCPVPLEEVESRIRLEPQGASVVLRLPRGTFAVSRQGRSQAVVVPGPDVTIER
jgi:hypothetical protein